MASVGAWANEIEEAQRLRYRVFANELGAQLSDDGGAIVGTYRLLDGTRLRFLNVAILQAAIDAGAVFQPVAIRYPGKKGAPNRAPAFIGDMTVIDSLFRILREPKRETERNPLRRRETRATSISN